VRSWRRPESHSLRKGTKRSLTAVLLARFTGSWAPLSRRIMYARRARSARRSPYAGWEFAIRADNFSNRFQEGLAGRPGSGAA